MGVIVVSFSGKFGILPTFVGRSAALFWSSPGKAFFMNYTLKTIFEPLQGRPVSGGGFIFNGNMGA
jgi:hypothetical protein